MQKINSIRNTGNISYYEAKKQSVPKQNINSIPASSIYHSGGMNALSSYNQASVSFEGFGFFKKIGEKMKDKKEAKLQKQEEKRQAREQKLEAENQAQQAAHTEESKKTELTPSAQPSDTSQTQAQTSKPEDTQTSEVKKAEEKKAETPQTADTKAKTTEKKKQYSELDVGFFEGTSQMKYLKMRNNDTGAINITWYTESGDIKGIQTHETDGREIYTTFYDGEGKHIKEDFITLPDGKRQNIKYLENGSISFVSDYKEDHKTLIKRSNYNYKKDTGKLDFIRTIFPEEKSIQVQWYRDDGTIDCKQFEKCGRVTETRWYFEDGETVKYINKPLEDGSVERISYDKDGRILVSDVTQRDKKTVDEATKYLYKENSTKYYKTETKGFDGSLTETWYNDEEVATCTSISENGTKTKTIWYFEDGETPQTEELYLADGRTQKVTMDKEGRWLDFVEYKDGKMSKTTHYIYKDDSETPHNSVTKYANGNTEKIWYDKDENMACRQLKHNDLIIKTEWFHKDGQTPKLVRSYAFIDEEFDESGNKISEAQHMVA